MTYQFTVSPDFPPDKISGWFIFNTWLQQRLGAEIHLELYGSFQQQRAAIAAGGVDLIYANPYDAAMLVREHRFAGLARPGNRSDEAIIVVRADNPAQKVEDLQTGIRVAATDDPDINMMGMILLEPADLDSSRVTRVECDAYVLVAKQLLTGKADVGIFLSDAYDGLSPFIRNDLRPLVRSEIAVVQHGLFVGPRMVSRHGDILEALLSMNSDPRSQSVLQALGVSEWHAMDSEDVEFMIDLIDTLVA